MKRLAVNDKFFQVALDLLDKQLKEMKAQATQILVELGQRHGFVSFSLTWTVVFVFFDRIKPVFNLLRFESPSW